MERKIKKLAALTDGQMNMLKNLGYDTSNASMAYYRYGNGKVVLREASDDEQVAKKCVPAFTLEDILDLLPVVELPFGSCGFIYPTVVKFADDAFACCYLNFGTSDGREFFRTTGSSGLEAALKMLLECHENGYFGKVTVLENGTKIYG